MFGTLTRRSNLETKSSYLSPQMHQRAVTTAQLPQLTEKYFHKDQLLSLRTGKWILTSSWMNTVPDYTVLGAHAATKTLKKECKL